MTITKALLISTSLLLTFAPLSVEAIQPCFTTREVQGRLGVIKRTVFYEVPICTRPTRRLTWIEKMRGW